MDRGRERAARGHVQRGERLGDLRHVELHARIDAARAERRLAARGQQPVRDAQRLDPRAIRAERDARGGLERRGGEQARRVALQLRRLGACAQLERRGAFARLALGGGLEPRRGERPRAQPERLDPRVQQRRAQRTREARLDAQVAPRDIRRRGHARRRDRRLGLAAQRLHVQRPGKPGARLAGLGVQRDAQRGKRPARRAAQLQRGHALDAEAPRRPAIRRLGDRRPGLDAGHAVAQREGKPVRGTGLVLRLELEAAFVARP
ncbi:MAG: hypothetical protein FJX21_13945 [Alphaproteobacteria bacterium]|nr:hypothetical protein [Alphaproteobacteria bacterium]